MTNSPAPIHHGWTVLDADAAVLWRSYEFSKGNMANTFVFRGADGGLVAVSPGNNIPAADLDALREFGTVTSIVANNGFHNLGQRPWQEHFKGAKHYAPEGSIPRLTKKCPGLEFAPTSTLARPDNVSWAELPGTRSGDMVLSVQTARGPVWYTSDLMANVDPMPGPPLSWLFEWTDSAPGLKTFRLFYWFFAKDKVVIQKHLQELHTASPPSVVVPGHGPAVTADDLAEQVRVQIARI
jgi:hypothetical protein